MKKCIGIDLGTTTSCVSVFEGNEKVVIPNSEGKRTTPSIVSFLENGERKIGDPAKRQAVTNPTNTIYSIKRFMGKKYKDVENLKMPYKVKSGSNGNAVVEIGGRDYTPQEISAMILQKMKKTAEDYLGYEVKDAVITVPAYFNDQERKSTQEAGEIAGLNVLRIINEPTAAALAYGLEQKGDKKIVVYDIGGGTSDVSILDMGDGVFEVKATKGDSLLGGDNFDEEIINWLAEDFYKENNVDLRKDAIAHQRLKEAAEKAKIELSTSTQTEINLPYIIPINGIPMHLVKTITRSQFEQMIDKYLDKLTKLCETTLKDSGLNKENIDEVILVGGSTRIPAVQAVVEKVFDKKANKNVNPDEAVSLGAAVQAAVLTGDVTDVLLLDVTPLNLSIETMGGVSTVMIESNTTIPVSKSNVFSTASDNQPSVEIHVLQGNRPMAKDNKSLGRFNLDGIPPAMRGTPQIEVTFNIDANGILEVSAHDKGTGKKQNIRIDGSSNLDKSEVERMKKEAEENAENDRKAKEEIDNINKADSLIFSTEKQMKEMEDKFVGNEKDELTSKVEELKKAKDSKDFSNMNKISEELTTIWNKISTRIYQSGNSTTNDSENSKPNDSATNVDFEEVK
jgi:molecular chaperone DnaK